MYECFECETPIPYDEEVWIEPNTGKASMTGYPYHVACAPEEY